MGRNSRRASQAFRRLYAGAVVVCLLAPSPAAAATVRRAASPSRPASPAAGLDGLRDAMASAGWAPSASLVGAPLALPAGAPVAPPYAGARE
ncbi:MAG: hypothetical protein SF051_00845, partial [Elusimicrobiota bacterium]|nr:hypothetical protein [Elusimicrobiota bacterium]